MHKNPASMPKLPLILLLLPFSVSCQTKKMTGSAEAQLPAENKPMTCQIEGKILEVLKPDKSETEGLCSRYPCRARVWILDVLSCGSSVSLGLNAGDTVTMRFAYTLHSTARLFPNMSVRYPGLKKGNVFLAKAEQRLAMGNAGSFVVTAYKRK